MQGGEQAGQPSQMARQEPRLSSLPYVGGKSSSGYGHVAYDYPTAPSPDAYLAYLDEHRDRIVQALDDLAMRLDGKRKVA